MSVDTAVSDSPTSRRSPRWASLMIALGILMTSLIGPAVFPSPADAGSHHTYARCYYPVAGWLVESRPCNSVHQLPVHVKQCIFGLAGATIIAAGIGAPLTPAVAGALVGCGGALIRD